MFPSLSQRGRLTTERSSRALAFEDSISSFQYDCTLDDGNDDESMTGVSFADETSISNLDEVFQRSSVIDASPPDLVSSSVRTDSRSSSLTSSHRSAVACPATEDAFGVPVDDLFQSFEEDPSSRECSNNKGLTVKKRQRSRRRGLGSSRGSSRLCSDSLLLDSSFLSRKIDGQSSWSEVAGRIDEQDIYVQLRGNRHTMSFDYLPATRQQSLRQALSERSASQRSLIGSTSQASRQGGTVRPRTQDELKVALSREFGMKSEASIQTCGKRDDSLTPPEKSLSPLDNGSKHRRESLQHIVSLNGRETLARAFPSAA